MKLQLLPHLKRKLTLSSLLFYLFIILSFISLLNPKWGTGYAAAQYYRGIDIVFAVDVSRSMDVRDLISSRTSGWAARISRLERGLSIAKQAFLSVPGGRAAVVIGRGRGYLSVPLTYDNEAALNFFESLDTQAMTGRSTNLQALVEAAADAFQDSSPARKVIVLISDGESHFGVLRNALNHCIREGIIIIAAAIGSDEGATVQGLSEEPLPVSKRDAQTMRMAAERTGGVYIDGNREDAASILIAQLLSLAQDIKQPGIDAPGAGRQAEPKGRRGLFVILAIIAYGAHKFVLRGGKRV